jgi:hypothetical protein
MDADRLVLLTSAADEADTGVLRSSLKAWARAGMLGPVAWVHADDLRSSLNNAPCEAAHGRNWVSGHLGAVADRGLTELWLVALRGSVSTSEQVRRAEDAACEAVLSQVGANVDVRSITVTVPGHRCEYRHWDFVGAWDAHLLHDRRVTSSSRAAMTDASGQSPLVLGAALALCVAAGWRGAAESLDLADHYTSQMKHPRIAHAQVRVLHAPDIASLGAPESPPWPAPRSAGAKAALAGSVPPSDVADEVVKLCRLECEPAPSGVDGDDPRGLWRSLLGTVRSPSPVTEAEFALGRLAQRTGGVTESPHDGMSRLDLEGVADLENLDALIEHIRMSRFPVGVLSSGALGSSPEVWQTMRSALLGLVDGSDLPVGVSPVLSDRSPDSERLVWLDPSVLAPARVPHDDTAQDIVAPASSTGLAEDRFRSSAASSDRAYRLGPKEPASMHHPDGEPDAPVGGEDPVDAEACPVAPEPAAPTRGDLGDDGDREGEWFEPEADALPFGGHHDTLMSRLGASADRGIMRAHAQFLRCAAVLPPDREHQEAMAARRRARAAVVAGTVAVLAAVAAGLDQRWPYLAAGWEAATPWQARTAYDPRIWPIGWILMGSAVAAAALWVCSAAVGRFRDAVEDLNLGESMRRRHAIGATHYAGELLRLHSLREQFRDHRRVLTEVLHRPFGDPQGTRRDAADPAALRFNPTPPASMLVGAADPSEELVEAEQKKLKEQMTRRGWLTSVYSDMLRAWEQQYSKRVLGDFARPDGDAAPRDATVYRDPRDGSPVRGAREDFASAVALDGWAVREAVASRWRMLLSGGAETDDGAATIRYLGLLEPPSSVHGPVGAHRSSEEFLDAGTTEQELAASDVRHRFSWSDTLAPAAAGRAPAIHAFATQDPVTAGRGLGAGTVVMMAWRVEYSDQVPPEHLRGWQDDHSDGGPRPGGGVT